MSITDDKLHKLARSYAAKAVSAVACRVVSVIFIAQAFFHIEYMVQFVFIGLGMMFFLYGDFWTHWAGRIAERKTHYEIYKETVQFPAGGISFEQMGIEYIITERDPNDPRTITNVDLQGASILGGLPNDEDLSVTS